MTVSKLETNKKKKILIKTINYDIVKEKKQPIRNQEH